MGKPKWPLRIAVTYIGTVIGAGFASGQEIIQFFSLHGTASWYGIALAALLFIVWGTFFLILAGQSQAESYTQLLKQYLGRWYCFFDLSLTFFLFIGLSVMLAGCGAVFAENLNVSADLGILSSAFISGLIVLFGIQGLMLANSIIVPLMFVLTVLAGVLTYSCQGSHWPEAQLFSHNGWLKHVLLYVAYNMILSIGVLLALGQEFKDKRVLARGAFLGGIGLGILLLFNNYSLLAWYPVSFRYQVPMLHIVKQYGGYFYWSYLLILWLEMLSTAIANLYSLAKKIAIFQWLSYEQSVCLMLLLVLPVSYFSFSFLIEYLYPLMGYFSLFLFFLLSWTFFTNKSR